MLLFSRHSPDIANGLTGSEDADLYISTMVRLDIIFSEAKSYKNPDVTERVARKDIERASWILGLVGYRISGSD